MPFATVIGAELVSASPEEVRGRLQWATERCTELDDGKLHVIVQALRPYARSSAEAAKCMLYLFRNRARMRPRAS